MSEQLHHKAIRLHLLWGYWRPEKTDKGVTQHANQTFGIKGNRGHYDKDLFSGEWMKPLREHTSKVKRYYYLHTLPWEDRVARLIATAALEEVVGFLNNAVVKYEEILRATVGDDAAYTQSIYDQRLWLGAAWDYKDYPSRERFMEKYYGEVHILPLTTVTDLRCELSDDLKAQIVHSVQRDTEERYRLAMADCWVRLYEPVKKMADTLGKKDQTFHDTLISNIREICDVMPTLNILDDPELKRRTDEVRDRLTAGVDPDVLRDNEFQRADYAKRADELADILRKMGVA